MTRIPEVLESLFVNCFVLILDHRVHTPSINMATNDRHIDFPYVYCAPKNDPRLTSSANGAVFTARRYASAVLAVIVCLSVRPSLRLSVCLSQVGVVQRWLNLGSD